MVVSCSGGQRVAHFAQPTVAGGVDGENRLNTFGELGGRFTADEYFMLRNLQRTDGLDLMNEFPGTFAVGDDQDVFLQPCADLNPALVAGFIRMYNNKKFNLTKSFITMQGVANIAANQAVLFNFFYRSK